MEIEPDWLRPYLYDRNGPPSLLVFRLTPTLPGSKQICVDYYYQRHWLAKIELQVQVERAAVPDPAQRKRSYP
jgi:hypothetical protein